MFKRFTLMAVVSILISGLNAETDIQDKSFTFEISKGMEIGGYIDLSDQYSLKKSSRIEIAVDAQQDGINFDGLIFNTITELVNHLNKDNAASIYLALMEKNYDVMTNSHNWEILASSKTQEELNKNLVALFQEFFESLSSKENTLKQAICFATFNDETIKNITTVATTCMQEYINKINALSSQSTTSESTPVSAVNDEPENSEVTGQQDSAANDLQKVSAEIKNLLIDLKNNMLIALTKTFESAGYKIDRSTLEL